MRLTMRVLYLTMAALVVGLIGTPFAQADIVPCNDPTCAGGPNYETNLSGEAAELAFVELVTGVNLDIFAKNEGGATDFKTTETSLTVTHTTGDEWDLSWT